MKIPVCTEDRIQAISTPSSAVFGELLAAQCIISVLPDELHICDFLAEALKSIPGISACGVFVKEASSVKGDLPGFVLKVGPSIWHDFETAFSWRSSIVIIPLEVRNQRIGAFVFRVHESSIFNQYHPFLANLAGYTAVMLDSRQKTIALQQLNKDLEKMVLVRTNELRRANEQLQTELADRIKAQKELHQSANEINDLYNHAPCGYHSLDSEGILIRMNDTELDWLRYSRDEIIGKKKFVDLLTARTQKTFCENFQTFKEQGQTKNLELELVRKDGSWYPVLLSATAIYDKTGKYIMSRSTVYDITIQKRAEQERIANLKYFESMDKINRVIQGGHDSKDMMKRILELTLEIFNCDRAFLVYPCNPDAPAWRIPMECTRPGYLEARALDIEVPMDQEMARTHRVLLKSDGPVIIQSSMSMAVYPSVGPAWQFGIQRSSSSRGWSLQEKRLLQGIGQRLSDGLSRMLVNAKLMASEERYRSIVSAISEGAVFQDKDGRIIEVNENALRILDVTRDQILGKISISPDNRTLHENGDEYPADSHPAMVTLRTGKPVHNAIMIVELPKGSKSWISINSEPLFRPNETKPYAVVTSFFDISDQKHFEQNLILAKEAAESATQAKSHFLDVAAHELRTPVTGLSLLLQFTKKRMLKGAVIGIDTIERLQKNVDRLEHLVVDLLDTTRLERGIVSLHFVRTCLSELVFDCVESFRIQAPDRQIRILSSPESESDVELDVDPVRITQVLTNLLENAVRYTPQGSPIEVLLARNADLLRVSVIDHGSGIPSNLRQKLFSPFSRGSTDLVERTHGLGLGLAICKTILELHRGLIGIEGTPGGGSTFYFDLPLPPRKTARDA